jgi:integrase
MTLTYIRRSFRWSHAIPIALQSRFSCGAGIAKSLTTRNRTLANAFAAYLSDTARRMFTLVEFHPELNTRELRLLVRNLKNLTDTVEIREGMRCQSVFLETDLEKMVDEQLQPFPSRRALVNLQRRFHDVVADFDRSLGRDQNVPPDRTSKRMSEVMLLFLQERKHNWRAHTTQMKRACLRTLLSIIGDQQMAQITRNDLAQFKDVVQRLPVRWEHMYPGVPIDEILEKDNQSRTLRPGSVNNYLAMAHTFFEWAYVNGYIGINPARKLKIAVKDRVRNLRSRLYANDLRQIFEESLYFSRSSARAAISARKVDPNTYHLFWIPLIALYSGLRAGEIVGLERQDICREEGVWCFRVRPNGIRDVKSACSNRSVPIHPVLLRMGFLTAIQCQELDSRQSIWKNLPKDRYNIANAFTRMWGEYKKGAGIDDPHKTFHSFRHTFIHALADVEYQVDLVAEIAGHSMKSEFYGRYRKRPDLRRLLKTIKRVTFPCRIDHLCAGTLR